MTSLRQSLKLGLVSSLALAACVSSKSSPGGGTGGTGGTTDPGPYGAAKFNPQLLVVDEAGAPVAGAKVRIGNGIVTAQADGTVVLPERAATEATVVTITSGEYAPVTKSLTLANSAVPLKVAMRGTVPSQVDSIVGGRVENGVAKVDLPARGFVKAMDGTPYVGAVAVRTATIAPQSDAITATSSDLLTSSADGPVPVRMRAQVYVDMQAADGTKVAFAAGQRAGVSFLLDQAATDKLGDKVPVWSLNETTGLWDETSDCTVQMSGDGKRVCKGEVEHFSLVGWGERWKISKGSCVTFTMKADSKIQSWHPVDGAFSWYKYVVSGTVNTVSAGAPVFGWTLIWGMDAGMAAAETTIPVSVAITGGKFLSIPVKVTLSPEFDYATTIPMAERYDATAPWKCQQILVDTGLTDMSVDNDGDGYPGGTTPGLDCNDDDKTIYPGGTQIICDGKDHDCSGTPDVQNLGAAVTVATISDLDWNLYCGQTAKACPTVKAALEVSGNARDENCDGFLSDTDGDGFLLKGDPGFMASGKAADCDDNNKDAFPGLPAGREKAGNEVDEDCDGIRSDIDGDGFPSVAEVAFSGKALTVKDVDCNDADPMAHPGAMITDLPVLAPYYKDGKRLASFCDLFDSKGKPSTHLRYLMFLADRNCNGYLEDLDGDGNLVSFAGEFTNAGTIDPNDLDPRVKTKGQAAPTGDPVCAVVPDLANFGSDARQACPRLFNQEQFCAEATRGGVGTGEWLCASPDYKSFTIPPEPLTFGKQYSPCSTDEECGSRSLCAGPITYAPEYVTTLKNMSHDVSMASFLGFCMPVCDAVP